MAFPKKCDITYITESAPDAHQAMWWALPTLHLTVAFFLKKELFWL
jgi:hypothetical protein